MTKDNKSKIKECIHVYLEKYVIDDKIRYACKDCDKWFESDLEEYNPF